MDPKFLIFVFVVVVVVMLVLAPARRGAMFARRVCRDCGAGHPAFARFCRRCGKRL
jgi:ribosomal protein L40E